MSELNIPLELAELLHATLGPLADVLKKQGHSWAPVLERVLEEYEIARDDHMVEEYGVEILPVVGHATYEACNRVCDMVDDMMVEATDFSAWDSEIEGERA